VQAALWDADEEIAVCDPGRGAWSYYVQEAGKTFAPSGKLPGLSMRTLISRLGIDSIDILKIDIEGAEARVFSGDSSWLDITRSIIVELHDRFEPGCARAFYGAIGKFPFLQDIDGESVIVRLTPAPTGQGA